MYVYEGVGIIINSLVPYCIYNLYDQSILRSVTLSIGDSYGVVTSPRIILFEIGGSKSGNARMGLRVDEADSYSDFVTSCRERGYRRNDIIVPNGRRSRR